MRFDDPPGEGCSTISWKSILNPRLIARRKRRFFRNVLLGAAWTLPCFYILGKLPPDVPFALIEGLILFPLIMLYVVRDKEARENLRARWKVYRRYNTLEHIKDSPQIQKYERGEHANCNCLGCRFAKWSIRKMLERRYLKAYCLKCRKEVNIKNPEQVIFRNNREAIKGICSVCGATVYKTGKFYGSTLFRKEDKYERTAYQKRSKGFISGKP